MRLHRVLADDEARGDLGVREALGEEPQHLELARRELGERRWRGGRRAARELVDQAAGDGRGEERASLGDDLDRGQQPLLGRILEQEPARAGAQRVVDDVVEVEGREHEDARARLVDDDRVASPRSRRRPACGRPSARRPVGARPRASPPRRRRRASPTTSIPGSPREDEAEAGADERLVVREQDPDHASSSYGSRAWIGEAAVAAAARRRSRRRRPRLAP